MHVRLKLIYEYVLFTFVLTLVVDGAFLKSLIKDLKKWAGIVIYFSLVCNAFLNFFSLFYVFFSLHCVWF